MPDETETVDDSSESDQSGQEHALRILPAEMAQDFFGDLDEVLNLVYGHEVLNLAYGQGLDEQINQLDDLREAMKTSNTPEATAADLDALAESVEHLHLWLVSFADEWTFRVLATDDREAAYSHFDEATDRKVHGVITSVPLAEVFEAGPALGVNPNTTESEK